MQLQNAETAAKYTTDRTTDPVVHVPGGKAGDGWKGKLSTIPVAAADKLFEQKSNLLQLKEPVQEKKPEADSDKKKGKGAAEDKSFVSPGN